MQTRLTQRGQRRNGPNGVALNLLASALTILTAIALLGAATVLTEAPLAAPLPVVDEETVYQFYDAVNTVLRTGDPRGLDRVAVPDLVRRTRANTLLPEPAELATTLLALHAIAPGLQLSVQETAATGDRVMVQLRQSTTAPMTWLGLPIDSSFQFWGPVDTLRFEGDRVAEVWSDAPPMPHVSVFGKALLDTVASSELLVSVQRLSTTSGAASDWSLGVTMDPRVLCVEAGGLVATTNPPGFARAAITTERIGQGRGTEERALRSGSSATVAAGETLALAPGSSATLHGDATRGPFLAYDVSFPRYRYTGPLQADPEVLGAGDRQVSSLQQDRLIDAAPAGVPPGVLEIACGRLVLPPRVPLVLGASDGSLMLAVEEGTLDLVLAAPNPKAAGASGESPVDGLRAMILRKHDSAILAPGATATLLAEDEPVRVMAITVRPRQGATP